jgi:hypothetical protein
LRTRETERTSALLEALSHKARNIVEQKPKASVE